MKKLVILIVIGFMVVLFSIQKPVKNTQPTVTIEQNIGLPNNAVKKLNDFLKP